MFDGLVTDFRYKCPIMDIRAWFQTKLSKMYQYCPILNKSDRVWIILFDIVRHYCLILDTH